MRAARLNGITIHFDVSGADGGADVVFVNSLGTDLRVWDRVVARLGPGVRAIRHDKRGHGLSEAPAAPYTLEDHVADLAALLDHIGLSGATVCGLSVGGMIALGLAAERPDLVARLVLSDTAHKIGTPDVWDARIRTIRDGGGIEGLADAVMERWFSASFRRDRADEVALWRALLTRTPLEGYVGTCHVLRDADLTDVCKRIEQPTLCFGGAEDGSTPPALMRQMTSLISNAEFHEIPGVGHLPCVEAPDTVATLIIDFLKEARHHG